MSKTTKKSSSGIQFTVRKEELKNLSVSDKFIYDVSLLRVEKHHTCLEDTKEKSSAKYVEDSTTHLVKDGVLFFKRVELIAAPKLWLDKRK